MWFQFKTLVDDGRLIIIGYLPGILSFLMRKILQVDDRRRPRPPYEVKVSSAQVLKIMELIDGDASWVCMCTSTTSYDGDVITPLLVIHHHQTGETHLSNDVYLYVLGMQLLHFIQRFYFPTANSLYIKACVYSRIQIHCNTHIYIWIGKQ